MSEILINLLGFTLIWLVVYYANHSSEKISYKRPLEFIAITIILGLAVSIASL